jgi:hypothetical protein
VPAYLKRLRVEPDAVYGVAGLPAASTLSCEREVHEE